jgi:hypothetical protein
MGDPARLRARTGGVIRSLVLVCALAAPAAAEPGWFVSAGAGLNTSHPFGELQLGHHFRAPFELYLDYSYDATISEFPFQTLGVGARTYFFHVGNLRIFHQALTGGALSSGGSGAVQNRTFGDRLLGGIFEQGLGVDLEIVPGWSVKAAVSTGYPVWLRSEVGVTLRW